MPKFINFIYIPTVIFLIIPINGFNISPKPNYSFQEPKLEFHLDKVESSYFGYSMNLRKNSIMVGAPRAQSTLDSQRKVNQTGAIYKCTIETGVCEPYVFDTLGNVHAEKQELTYESSIKSHQMLGAVMDGHNSESDRFVVCAPNIITEIFNASTNEPEHYLYHGICYWTPNTIDAKPLEVKSMSPLRVIRSQQVSISPRNYVFNYMFGQMGFNVHMTDNSEEILMGAPGVWTWKGTVVRYKSKINEESQLSRRDEFGQHSIRRRAFIEYVSDIPNPNIWNNGENEKNDTYFGYAVTSGYFDGPGTTRLLYVASAPQGDLPWSVAVFDIVDAYASDPGGPKTIKIYETFSEQQLGEYFGYALVSEDFNNDGYVDIAVAAPFYSNGLTSFDNGRVYIYLNKKSLRFEPQVNPLSSGSNTNGRFGTAITKIGDINLDGYKDFAVGAPFEGNGAVYIYLGGANGLSSKFSQRIEAPVLDIMPSSTAYMFGHYISKGSDIDGNFYNDIAIGAPNADHVYIYRTYPVVKIITSITPLKKELAQSDTSFQINFCWSLETPTELVTSVETKFTIKMDQQLKRATFSDGSNEIVAQYPTTLTQTCSKYDIGVKFSLPDVFKPITFEVHHEVIKVIPDTTEFCNSCVATNPEDSKVTRNNVVFITGCASTTCLADLVVQSQFVDFVEPYIIGSSRSIALDYNVENKGEAAYLTRISIKISKMASFMKIPSSCELNEDELLCILNNGLPLFSQKQINLIIAIDTTRLEGTELSIEAKVFSTGDEEHPEDNSVSNLITLGEFSEIEVIGTSDPAVTSVEEVGLVVKDVSHSLEIRNNGPSNIKNMYLHLWIPIAYSFPYTDQTIDLIDKFDDLTIKARYNNREMEVSLSQNNNILIQSVQTTPAEGVLIVDNMIGMGFDSSKSGLDHEFNNGGSPDTNEEDQFNNQQFRRRRRHIVEDQNYRKYNYYTRKVQEHRISKRSTTTDPIFNNIPINRTILINCRDDEIGLCVKATMQIQDFKAGSEPIKVKIDMKMDFKKIDTIYTEERDIFVYIIEPEIQKVDDDEGKSIGLTSRGSFTVITKYLKITTPIWVYIVSTIGGLLVLILLTYGLYKMGFFKREKKEELQKLARQSQLQDDEETEDEL